MRTFSLAALSMSLTCFSTIAFLMASRPASGPLTFWAWIRPQRTTLGMGAPSEDGTSLYSRAMGQPGDEEVIAADERRLAGLGYKQELRRGMGAFSNYA